MSDPAPKKLVASIRRTSDRRPSAPSPASNATNAVGASLQQLIDNHQAMLIVMLRTRGLGFSEIDDVCQEVWLKAWNHLQTGRTLERPAGWLRRVAMNVVYSSKRGRQQIPASQLTANTSEEQLFANLADEHSAGVTALGDSRATIEIERRSAIRSCLDSLGKSDGEIVQRVYTGMKPRQIAAELNIEPNMLYTKKHRAMERFKNCLEGKLVPS